MKRLPLANPTIKAAAASLKCSESAIYKRLKDPEFKQELKERRTLLLEEAMNVLQGRMLEAVEIIADIMSNEEASPQTRLNAAESLLRNSLKLSGLVSEENERNKSVFDDIPLFRIKVFLYASVTFKCSFPDAS